MVNAENKIRKIKYLYHGTVSTNKNSISKGIDLSLCKSLSDFGSGFYLTTNEELAINFARQVTMKNNIFQSKMNERNSGWKQKFGNPIVFRYTINQDELYCLNLLAFADGGDEWAEFVLNNRMKEGNIVSEFHNHNQFYDAVIGPITTGAVGLYLEEVRMRKINFKEFAEKIKALEKKYGEQLSINSESGIRLIEFDSVDLV